MENEFRITGKHVLMTLIGFFFVVLAANAIFLNLALKTFPGEKEEKSYLQGLNYNDRLAARAEQDALGWKTVINKTRLAGDELKIELTVLSQAGAPVSDLKVEGVLSRPATEAYDQHVVFTPIGGGQYQAVVSAGAGVWSFEGKAANSRRDQFEFTSRWILK